MRENVGFVQYLWVFVVLVGGFFGVWVVVERKIVFELVVVLP